MGKQDTEKQLLQKHDFQIFPSGPVVKTLCFCCKGHKFDPWLGKFHMVQPIVIIKKQLKKKP